MPQEAPQIIPPAPNSAALAEYADIPISKYTGIPNISIPLYTIETGGFQLPISISYHASGIKVAQEASSVGLGWALNAGGVITREVRGIDDFDNHTGKKGYLTSISLPPFNDYLEGFDVPVPIWSADNAVFLNDFINFSFPNSVNQSVITYTRSGVLVAGEGSDIVNSYYKEDTESDLYSFNFGSFSGKFVVNKDGSTVLFSPESGLKIKVINTNSWQVTATDGIIYKFSDKDYTTPHMYSQDHFSDALFDVKGSNAGSGSRYISSWYLSEILLPNGESINFYYDKLNTESWNYGPTSVRRVSQISQFITCSYDYDYLNNFNSQYTKSSSVTDTESFLKTIVWNNGSINITMSDREDIDASGPQKSKKIDMISVKQKNGTPLYNSDGTEISNIRFNYSYFNSQDYNEPNNYFSIRLKLDLLTIDDKEYNFNYIDQNSLPWKNSNSKDHWGYYNDAINLSDNYSGNSQVPYFLPELMVIDDPVSGGDKSYEGANRDCNPTVLKNGMLEAIQYPTRGLVPFEYEPNDFEYQLSPLNSSFGLIKYEDKYQDIEYSVINYATVSTNTQDNPYLYITLTETSTLNFELEYSPYGPYPQSYLVPVDSYGNGRVFGNLSRIDGGGSYAHQWEYIPGTIYHKYNDELVLPAGTYIFNVSSAQNFTSKGTAQHSIDQGLATSKKVEGGGVRVNEIISDAYTRKFDYNLVDDAQKSSGKLLVEPYYSFVNYGMFNCYQKVFVRQSSSTHSLSGFHSGAPVGYSSVKESISDPSGNTSSTITHYKNAQQYISRGASAPAYPVYENGLIINEKNLSNTKVVSETEYNYHNASYYDQYVETYFLRIDFAFGNYYALTYYKVEPEWWQLESVINKNYFYDDLDNQSVVSNTTEFKYNPDNYQVNEKTSYDSKGRTIKQKITFPTDYSSYVYSQMQSRNIITSPIESITLTDGKVTDAKLTTYELSQLYPDGGEIQIGYFPEHSYSFKSVNHPSETVFENYDGVSPSSTYYKKVLNYKYDLWGNIIEYSTDDGITYSFLWGYNNNYPVAKIENATFNDSNALISSSILDNPSDENSLRVELQKLRDGLPNAMVTTYTYAPLIGVTSITDPRGELTTYHYHDFNRLEFVKDAAGSILSENKYNYKDQVSN